MLVAAQYSKTQQREVTTYYVSTRERGSLHCSIQQAIDKAEPFSRIVLAAGQYFESVTVTQPIELIGEEGDPPVICSRGVCISVNADVECFFEGLHILSKIPAPRTIFARDAHSAVRITKGKPTFYKCKMTSVYVGGHSYPTIHHCTISGNIAGCGLIVAEDADGEYLQNAITNHIPYCVLIKSRGTPTLTENTIYQEPKIINAMLASAPQLPRSGGAVLISADGGSIDTDKSISPKFLNNRIGDEVIPNTVSLSCFAKWFPRLASRVHQQEANNSPVPSKPTNTYRADGRGNSNLAPSNVPRKKSLATYSRVVDDRSYAALAEREAGLQSQLCERETVKVDAGCSPLFEDNHMTGGHASLVICSGGAGSFSGNNISHGTFFGVHFHPFSSAALKNNVITQCGTGILLTASNASISSNTVSDCIGAGCVLFTSPKTRCFLDSNSFVANDVGLIAHQLHKPPRHVASLMPVAQFPKVSASAPPPSPEVGMTVADVLVSIDDGPSISTLSKGMICLNKSCGALLVGSALQLSMDGVDVGANGPLGVITAFGAPPLISKCRFERGAVGLLICERADPLVTNSFFENHSEAGISVEDHGRGIIKDCDFKSFTKAGVRVIDAGQPTIIGNNFTALEGIGIDVSSGGIGIIEKNNFNTIFRGIAVSLFADPVILDNKIRSATDVGILLHNEGCGTVVGNRITECNVGIASITGGEASIRNNSIGQCTKWGIYCGEGSLSLIEKNKISESSNANVMLEGVDNTSILRGNLLERSHRFGLHMARGAEATFIKNILKGDAVGGIASELGDKCLIVRNSIEGSVGPGITIAEGGSSTFVHNDIHNGCADGVYVSAGGSAKVSQCIIRDNEGNGIAVESGSGGEISDCNVHDNRKNGVNFVLPTVLEGGTSNRRLKAGDSTKLTHLFKLNIHGNYEAGVLVGHGCLGKLADCIIRDHKAPATAKIKAPTLLTDLIPYLNGQHKAFPSKDSSISLLAMVTQQKWLVGIRCIGSQSSTSLTGCVVIKNDVGMYAGAEAQGELSDTTLMESTFADVVMASESNFTIQNSDIGMKGANRLPSLPKPQSHPPTMAIKSSENPAIEIEENAVLAEPQPSAVGIVAFGTSKGQVNKCRIGNCYVAAALITGLSSISLSGSDLRCSNVGLVIDLQSAPVITGCKISQNKIANCIVGPQSHPTLTLTVLSKSEIVSLLILGTMGMVLDNTIARNIGIGIVFASSSNAGAFLQSMNSKSDRGLEKSAGSPISQNPHIPTPPMNKLSHSGGPKSSLSAFNSGTRSALSSCTNPMAGIFSNNTICDNEGVGILFLESTLGSVLGNTFQRNTMGGAQFQQHSEVKFYENVVSENKKFGLAIMEKSRPVVTENKISSNEVANIILAEASQGAVMRNTISNGRLDGIAIHSGCITSIEGNTIDLHACGNGISIIGPSPHLIIKANCITSNQVGIHAQPGGAQAAIEANTFNHNAVCGIILDDLSDVMVLNNTFDGASCCIQLRSNARGHVKRNTFMKSTEAIAISGSAVQTDCQDNNFVGNHVGFVLRGSDSSFHLKKNTFGAHEIAAVIVEAGSTSVICDNNFEGGARGILVRGGSRPWIRSNIFLSAAIAVEIFDASAIIDHCLCANNDMGVLLNGPVDFVGERFSNTIDRRLLVVDSVFNENQQGIVLRHNPRLEAGGVPEDALVTRCIFRHHTTIGSKIACAVLCEAFAPPAQFEENDIGDNTNGIICKGRCTSIFSRNLCHDNDVGIVCEGERCTPVFKDSVLLNNKSKSVQIANFAEPTIRGCLIREGAGIDLQVPVLTINTSTLKPSAVASIHIAFNGGGTIEGCVFRCCSVGVLAEGARNLSVTNNKFSIVGCGIVAKGMPSHNTTVVGNAIQSAEIGIGISTGGMLSTVRDCHIYECDYGFFGIDGGQCTNIVSSAFLKCSKYGILLRGVGRFEFKECVSTQCPIGASVSAKAQIPYLQKCQDYFSVPDASETTDNTTDLKSPVLNSATKSAQPDAVGFAAFATLPPDTYRIVTSETLQRSPFAFARYVNYFERCRFYENKLGVNIGNGFACFVSNLVHHNDTGLSIGSASSQDYSVILHKNASFENTKMGCTICTFNSEKQLSADGNQFYSPREGGLEVTTALGGESVKQLKDNETLNNCAYKQQIPTPLAPLTPDADQLPNRQMIQRCDELLTALPPIIVKLFADVPQAVRDKLSKKDQIPLQTSRVGIRSQTSHEHTATSSLSTFYSSRLICSAATKLPFVLRGRPEDKENINFPKVNNSPDKQKDSVQSHPGRLDLTDAAVPLAAATNKRETTPITPRKPSAPTRSSARSTKKRNL